MKYILFSLYESRMYWWDARIFVNAFANNLDLTYSIIAFLILSFSVVIFSLFWFVFRYNLLYVLAFSYNTKDQLYSTTLKQLFIEIYIMKLCLIDLFLFIRNDRDVFININ